LSVFLFKFNTVHLAPARGGVLDSFDKQLCTNKYMRTCHTARWWW